MWKQTGCIFNPAEIPSVLKEGQSLANISPGTCLRASFYARAPLAASFTPYSIRSLTLTINIEFTLTLNIEVKLSTIEIYPTDVFSIDNIISLVLFPTSFNNTVYTITTKALYTRRTKNDVAIII